MWDIGIAAAPGRPYAPAATSIAWASLSPNGSRLARSSCVRTEAVNATNDRCVEGRVDVVDVSTGKPSGQPVTGFPRTSAPSSTAQVTASSRSPASGGTRQHVQTASRPGSTRGCPDRNAGAADACLERAEPLHPRPRARRTHPDACRQRGRALGPRDGRACRRSPPGLVRQGRSPAGDGVQPGWQDAGRGRVAPSSSTPRTWRRDGRDPHLGHRHMEDAGRADRLDGRSDTDGGHGDRLPPVQPGLDRNWQSPPPRRSASGTWPTGSSRTGRFPAENVGSIAYSRDGKLSGIRRVERRRFGDHAQVALWDLVQMQPLGKPFDERRDRGGPGVQRE